MNAPGRMRVEDLDTPVLLLDREALERNIARMSALAAKAGVKYRPHAKSHKSPLIAQMQLAAGAAGICCAKLGEAEVMAVAGVPDILITTEVVGRSKLMRLMSTAHQSRVAVVADDEHNIAELAGAAQTAGARLDVLIEVDIGQGRCGVPPGPEAARLARLVAGNRWLRFRGLQGYHGAIQMIGSYGTRTAQVRDALGRLMETAEHVRKAGLEIEVLTGGGTGTSVIDGALHGYTELQPGSYVFMDSKYRDIEWTGGAAQPFETSLTILGTVISRPAPDRAIVDVGLKAASSDHGPIAPVGLASAAYAFAGDEHGHLRFEGGRCPLAVGDRVTFVPSHCDTTVNLYDRFIVTKGGYVEDVWDIAARGRVQ
jgi:D-serine deaminase-like pyridoxal phosphate-dependent protein